MKTLIVSFPYLNGVGGAVYASRAYINAIAKISDETTLVYPDRDEKHAEGIDSRVIMVPVNYDIPIWKKVLVRIKGNNHYMTPTVTKLLRTAKFDLVVFNGSFSSCGIIGMALYKKIKVVTLHHNFEQEYCKDNLSGHFFMDRFYIRNAVFLERQAVLLSNLNLTITDADKQLLYEYYSPDHKAKIATLGCFEVEKRRMINTDARTNGSHRFVITGSLSQIQTCDSLSEWLKRYYSFLIQECPDATLTIAGRNPSSEILMLCNKYNINLVPNPESMEIILLNADYYICPICKGGGLKLRVMDGLSAGLPVLTHSVSVRGYESFLGDFVYQYSDENTFRSSLTKMISGTYDAKHIQKEYYSLFDFSSGVQRMRQFLLNID